jgi:hypothetical protein
VIVLVLSNFASSAKLIDWGFSIAGIPIVFDAGTVFFPIAYVVGDILTEVYGFKRARRVIWIGFGALVFSFLMFLLIRSLPGETLWLKDGGQDAFDLILGGLSSGGIVLASLAGYLGGSFSNAMSMAIIKNRTQGKHLWIRTIGSTLLGELLDTALFVGVATLTGVFSKDLFWSLLITNYIFKVIVEVLCTPLTYWSVRKLKQSEGIDVFTDPKDLNPFAF